MCRNRALALHNASVNSTSLSMAMCSSDVPHMTFLQGNVRLWHNFGLVCFCVCPHLIVLHVYSLVCLIPFNKYNYST
jgi:hypothetical protein